MAARVGDPSVPPNYDRAAELEQFDATKAGVKGLADAGITKLPRIFIHSPDDLPTPHDAAAIAGLRVPVIDLRGFGGDDDAQRRREMVERIREASSSWGFFQLVNHGIPAEILEGMLQATRRFHDLDAEEKAKYYTRDLKVKIKYISNFDLFQSRAANWRDTLACMIDPHMNPDEIPDCFRDDMLAFVKHMNSLAEIMFELLSEGLGLRADYLKSIGCFKPQYLGAHYYPPCPEPELTLGTSKHTDPSFLTLLIEDDIGGLQIRHKNHWLDVSPIPGAVIVFIGDFLTVLSNDKYKSAEHRVLATLKGPRLSVAIFFNESDEDKEPYASIKEILADGEVPKYREVPREEYNKYFSAEGIGGEPPLNHFRNGT